MNALLGLTLRQMLGGKRIWFVALMLAIPVVLTLALQLMSGFDVPPEARPYAMALLQYTLYPQSLCILLCLLYGTSLFSAEIEGKTLVYLFTRAQPRWRVLAAKFLATAAALAVLSVASMSLSFLIAGLPLGPRLWLALTAATAGACIVYTAIFALLGLLVPGRAIAVGLIYVLTIEVVLSLVPALVNEATASYYLRSIAFQLADVDLQALDHNPWLLRMFGGATLLHGAGALAAMTFAALAAAAAVVHRSEYPLSE